MVYNFEQTMRDMKNEALMEGKLEIVKNMLSKNMSEDLIEEVVGLSREQIQKIKTTKDNLQ